MIHLSDPNYAIHEIELLKSNGFTGCIIENYHGSTNDVIYVLKSLTNFIKKDFKIGINILPNDYEMAFNLANRYDCDFIQVDYVAGEYLRVPKIDTNYFQLFKKINPNVTVLGGVWPKYYTPVKTSILKDDIEASKLLADAIVVTGKGTGKETPLDKIKEFKELCGDHPLIIGAGVNPSNSKEQLQYANGCIVGSCLKKYGVTTGLVNQSLITEFCNSL